MCGVGIEGSWADLDIAAVNTATRAGQPSGSQRSATSRCSTERLPCKGPDAMDKGRVATIVARSSQNALHRGVRWSAHACSVVGGLGNLMLFACITCISSQESKTPRPAAAADLRAHFRPNWNPSRAKDGLDSALVVTGAVPALPTRARLNNLFCAQFLLVWPAVLLDHC